MKRRIKESKNIFPCTVYMENQDYDEVYYYLDTPEYGLSWRYFDDVEQEDIENYKYIIKNIADLRKAIDDLEEDFIHGYGNSYFKLSENYMEDLLTRGKTLVRVKKEHKERVYIIRVKPAQNVELALAESFEKTIKNLQREGLFENVSSFDLNFNGRGINIKLNEGYPAYRKDSPKMRDANADADEVLANNLSYKYLKQTVKSFDAVAGKSDTFKYYVGKRIEYSLPKVIGSWMAKIDIKDEACRLEIAVGYDYDDSDNIQVLIGIYQASNGILRPSTRRILTTVGLKPAVLGSEDGNDSHNFDVNGLVDTAPIRGFVFMSESISRATTILRNLKKKLDLVNRSWNDNFAQNEKEYYVKKGLIPSSDLNDARKKRLNSIEKNAKRDAAHRYESFKRVSNLRENESDESKYPFTDLIVDYMNRYYDVCDFWPALRPISTSAFYDEVSEETGMDYDDVKDCCWDMVPDIPPLNEMFNKLVYLGSEKYLSEKYGTLKNLQKVIDKDNAETEAACEEFANRFDSLYDEEDLENEYKEAVDFAVADLEARFNRDDEDDDED